MEKLADVALVLEAVDPVTKLIVAEKSTWKPVYSSGEIKMIFII